MYSIVQVQRGSVSQQGGKAFLITTLSGDVNIQDVLSTLDLGESRHLLEPDQFGRLGDVRIALNGGNRDDLESSRISVSCPFSGHLMLPQADSRRRLVRSRPRTVIETCAVSLTPRDVSTSGCTYLELLGQVAVNVHIVKAIGIAHVTKTTARRRPEDGYCGNVLI